MLQDLLCPVRAKKEYPPSTFWLDVNVRQGESCMPPLEIVIEINEESGVSLSTGLCEGLTVFGISIAGIVMGLKETAR